MLCDLKEMFLMFLVVINEKEGVCMMKIKEKVILCDQKGTFIVSLVVMREK